MDEIIALLIAVDWLADDLHYNFSGPGFYENHLLADRVRDFGGAEDDLKEVFYLGFKETTPPNGAWYSDLAKTFYNECVSGNPCLLTKLLASMIRLCDKIEEVKSKNPELPSGVVAILDSISTSALRYKFLLQSQSRL